MNAKFGFIFLGCIFLLEAIWALFGGKIYFRFHGWQTIDEKSIFGFFIVGLFFICLGTKYKIKYPEFTKCPKCKKSYNYSDTIKGKCPKCNIDTIEIEKYYKQFPSELEILETDIKDNKK